jgi:hypothetical protein
MATAALVSDAMNRAEDNASPEFKRILADSIVAVATRRRELTTDDVWEEFEKRSGIVSGDRSAIGPVMMKAVRKGIIQQKTGFSKNSTRPSTHGRLLRVFKSMVSTQRVPVAGYPGETL